MYRQAIIGMGLVLVLAGCAGDASVTDRPPEPRQPVTMSDDDTASRSVTATPGPASQPEGGATSLPATSEPTPERTPGPTTAAETEAASSGSPEASAPETEPTSSREGEQKQQSERQEEPTPKRSVNAACGRAWGAATSVDEFQDTHEDYRQTLTACSTAREWMAQNEANGARLYSDPTTIANLCQTLRVTSTLCSSVSP